MTDPCMLQDEFSYLLNLQMPSMATSESPQPLILQGYTVTPEEPEKQTPPPVIAGVVNPLTDHNTAEHCVHCR